MFDEMTNSTDEESLVTVVDDAAVSSIHVEDAEEVVGLYPEITRRFKNGEQLTDEEIDKIVDVALSILRDLLGFFDAGSAPIDEYDGDDGELILDVTAPDLAVLIGRHGRTLDSFQTIFSLLVSRKLGFRYPLVVDIEGYKSRRHDKITDMAKRSADRAVRQNRPVSLKPMNAYERRLVHIALRDVENVDTHSEGIDPDRYVVITPL